MKSVFKQNDNSLILTFFGMLFVKCTSYFALRKS